MKSYYSNTKIYLTNYTKNSIISKIIIIILLWAVATIPCWIAIGISSLLGVTSGITAVIAFGIFIFFAGSFQILLWVLAIFLTVTIFH